MHSNPREFSRSRVLPLLIATAVIAILAFAVQASAQKIVTFDVTGAGTAAGQGTFAYVIQGKWVAGNYIDASNVYHGFLRAPDGTITKFDVPRAGTAAGQGTIEVKGMTPALEIVGTNMDANNVFHGFLRTRYGKFTIFDAPSAGTGSNQGTGGLSVNPEGMILGIYLDADNVYHGLLRAPNGALTPFDPPGVGTEAYQGTYPANLSGINSEGANVGEIFDASYVYHGYLRAPNGSYTEFDDPNAGTGAGSGQGTLSLGINPAGEISGVYIDANYVFHGFMRDRDGMIRDFDVPGAGTGAYQGTNACWFIVCWGGINPAGTITGFYVDNYNVYHGFLRTRDGEIERFNAPGAGTAAWQGTQPMTISSEGAITGSYTDANNVVHGFLRAPW